MHSGRRGRRSPQIKNVRRQPTTSTVPWTVLASIFTLRSRGHFRVHVHCPVAVPRHRQSRQLRCPVLRPCSDSSRPHVRLSDQRPTDTQLPGPHEHALRLSRPPHAGHTSKYQVYIDSVDCKLRCKIGCSTVYIRSDLHNLRTHRTFWLMTGLCGLRPSMKHK